MQVSGAFVHLILIYFVLLCLITFPYKYVCLLSVAGRRQVWWRWGPNTLTCTSQVTSSMPAPPGWTTCHWSAPLCWVSSASSMSCTKKSVPWLPKQLCWTPLMLTTNIVRRSVKLQILQNPEVSWFVLVVKKNWKHLKWDSVRIRIAKRFMSSKVVLLDIANWGILNK